MKVALDATYSLGENLSGVGVYSREILSRLPVAHPEARYQFCYRPHRFLRSWKAKLPPNCSRALLWRSFPRSADIFHGLNQRIDARHTRTVCTFHDLFVMTGEYSTPDFRRRFASQAKLAAERSDLVLAVSQFTADQVHDLLGVERSRIRVIRHGVTEAPFTNESREQLILFVGAIQRRKNVLALVQAFEQVAPGWKLVLAGSQGYGAGEALQAIERSTKKTAIDLAGYVSRQTLEELYRRAAILAFPSLDEGFGMPVIEAMSRGVAVLTSNGSALREIAEGAALLVDPRDTHSIAAGLIRLTEDAALRHELVAKGRARSARFTWEAAVDSIWSVYRELSLRV